MRLVWFRVNGYRRFREESTLNATGKLLALVGQNEAGKTSMLRALEHIGHDRAFGAIELTREFTLPSGEPVLEAGFFLEASDHRALSRVPHSSDVRWLTVRKLQDGERRFDVHPSLSRDLTLRHHCAAILKKASRSPAVDPDSNLSPQQLRELANKLMSTVDTLPEDVLEDMKAVRAAVSAGSDRLPKYLTQACTDFDSLYDEETQAHPNEAAKRILARRMPSLLFFDDEARELRSEYNLEEVVSDQPKALKNLATVAGLDLQALLQAAKRNDRAAVNGLLTRSHDALDDVFGPQWNQSGVQVRFDLNRTVLNVQIEDEGRRFSTLGERSDGLRQFVALLAFATVEHGRDTILLIDEAEAHLHYDAQADLVQMFATQKVASKVIYTTHSAGCLPEDLGVGVRLISPTENRTHSRITNWFWTEGEPGFAPLLFGMGARTLAFFPTRRALVVEGISDLILLPTLLREAVDTDHLGFQIVPGLSQASAAELGVLEISGSSVCYLVDNDPGGHELREQLLDNGIQEERIFAVSPANLQAKTVEDFVDPTAFRTAANRQLSKWHQQRWELSSTDIPASGRVDALETWTADQGLRALSKRALAYEIVDLLRDDPNMKLLDGRRRDVLRRLHDEILDQLSPV